MPELLLNGRSAGNPMILSDNTEKSLDTVMSKLSTELVSDPGEILSVLTESKQRGTAVGIRAAVLGKEIYVTAVEEIVMGDEITIILKNYDTTGYMLETNKLKLGEIASVCPFRSPFENPYMRTLNYSRSL